MLGGAPRAQEVLSVSGFSDVPKTFLLESESIPIKRYLSSTPVACANNLQRETIWIDNVETFPDATLS